jgi:phage terminase Nu1 subunit (DNA packaging protein)
MSVASAQQTRGSKSEYARHRGVSPSLVTKWVKTGRIVLDAGGAVLFEASDAALATSSHPLHGGRRTAGSKRAAAPLAVGGFIESKQRQTDATADLLELRLQRERGEVHETAACGQAITAALAGPLSKLDSLAVRIAPALAAETQVRRIQDVVEDEISMIRQEIADALRGLATNGSATKQ